MNTPKPLRALPALCALVMLASLAACGGLLSSDRPSEHNWWLDPLVQPSLGDRRGAHLAVQVAVVPGLNTDRIVTLDPDARLNHYAGARWADHLPDLLESLVVRSMENTGRHATVSARVVSRTGGCHLDLEVRRFFGHLDANGQTRGFEVDMAGYYGCGDDSRRIEASASTPLGGNRMPDIVSAAQRSLDQVLAALVEQM